MFNFSDTLSSIFPQSFSLFNAPPPLPDAYGVGPNFDWSTHLQHATPSPSGVDHCPGPETSTPSRPVSATPGYTSSPPSSSRSTSSTMRPRFTTSGQRRAHPYRASNLNTRTASGQVPDALFDWSSIASPTPAFSGNCTLVSPGLDSPYQTPCPRFPASPLPIAASMPQVDHPGPLFPALYSDASGASSFSSPPALQPQARGPSVRFASSHAASAPSADWPTTTPLALPTTNHFTSVGPSSWSATGAQSQLVPDVGVTGTQQPNIFGQLNGLLAPHTTFAPGEQTTPTTRLAQPVDMGTNAVPYISIVHNHGAQTPLFLPDSPSPHLAEGSMTDVERSSRLGESTATVPSASGTPIPYYGAHSYVDLTEIHSPNLSPGVSMAPVVTNQVKAASVAPVAPAITAVSPAVPAILTVSTDPAGPTAPVAPVVPVTKAASVVAPAGQVPSPSSNTSLNESSTLVNFLEYSEPDANDVDNELAQAYGLELTDTGFQGGSQSLGKDTQAGEASGKSKSSKSPRQKKPVPAGTKWAGGPGGPLKFNANCKPEGYVEGTGRLSRWSYSDDGTASQDVNERLAGDVHFSPAIQYTPDDDPFMSWVCALTPTGLLRWVSFKAGQPHPQYKGYVFKPAQLPRTAPRWLKETSYKSTQLSAN